ncbi:AzlC family ABC transporter permease [Noviherbaspirillum sedimenti]|uniref:Branched-chain amino acid ABC transporter permease n=1 Tax=Noviherbaspirillum sedimenti TaxID=2320865 RepID=A0A3A3G8C1_9BURK|nr:AzlC family ABC transporter permease [Noviherbaspirillum sedimenti]RJG03885.1 branched-chain amino acid ABC transporter permease [Noviherbaspirillum sedimenti]
MQASFREGAREGFRVALPQSIGLIPWALVTGVAMVTAGFTPLQAMGMNVIVFAGVAQLGTLPLIVAGAPPWLIITTALVLNLRFLIFSAAIARGFRDIGAGVRWLSSYLLIDGVFAACLEKMLTEEDRHWRLGYYLAPSVWSWLLWQIFALTGVLAAGAIPRSWSIEFMATIALIVILLPMAKFRPMLVAAATGGSLAVLLHGMPLRLGVIVAIIGGIGAGFLAEHWQTKRAPA